MADNVPYTGTGAPQSTVSQRTRELSANLHVPFVLTLPAATGTQTSPATSTASATILASNALRLGATIYNDAVGSLFVKFGATASATSFAVKMAPGAYYEIPYAYTGIIDAILDGGTGNARVTEFAA